MARQTEIPLKWKVEPFGMSHPYVACLGCGDRLSVAIGLTGREFACPICQSTYALRMVALKVNKIQVGE